MVNRALLIGLLTLLAIPIHSQENNVSFFSEGKVWNYIRKMYGDTKGIEDHRYSTTAHIDHIEDGTTYWKLEKDGDKYGIYHCYAPGLVEENSKVYWPNSSVLFDFNMKIGEYVDYKMSIKSIDYINVKGYIRKRYTLDYEDEYAPDIDYFIVEGIGDNTNAYIGEELCSTYYELQSVYENGKCIFTKEDFFAEPATGIQEIEAGQKTNTRIYDLNGRPVTTPRPNGLYIRNRQVFRQP